MYKVPIVFFAYNRPDLTRKVLEKILLQRPANLYVFCDGPKENHQDIENVTSTRNVINELLKEHKVVATQKYYEFNSGFEKTIVKSLDQVFKIEKQALIIEDDCLPSISFFKFCEEMLQKYNDNKLICHISGSRYIDGDINESHSYYFSKYPIVGAWCTWSDRWEEYDPKIKSWPRIKEDKFFWNSFKSQRTKKYWRWIFNNCYKNKISSWGYKWIYINLTKMKLSIIPKRNLIKNIGVGNQASNTVRKNSNLARNFVDLEFPLKHPLNIKVNDKNDNDWEKKFFNKSPFWLEIFTKRLKPVYKKIFLRG